MTSFFASIATFVTAIASVSFTTADFQTSTATCVFNAADRSLMVDLEVSTGNLTELILKQSELFELDLEKAKDQRVVEEFIIEYLEQNFLLIQEGKQLRQSFLKMEVLKDKTHLVFDVEIITVTNIKLKNTLFFDLYPDQINIVKINSAANSNDYYFNSKAPEQSIAL